ncbi:MAG: transglutaminase domain-containing protein [Candidatus Methylacidiphilales bacterium]
MIFRITHKTVYHYQSPASESYGELRICPLSNPSQAVLKRQLTVTPATRIRHYDDVFGNRVEFFSIPHRHDMLEVHATAEVRTHPQTMPEAAELITIAESRQVLARRLMDNYIYLRATPLVPLHGVLTPLRTDFIKRHQSIASALLFVNQWIHKNIQYQPGVTNSNTALQTIIQKRRGVCQDFAHLMLSILRTYEIPARYVSGYIEAYDPSTTDPALVGATASHAWVEALLPGGQWVGLDPTNNQIASERHVRVAVGRDYQDVAPLTGTFKGAHNQNLNVIVSVKRKKKPSL